MKQVRFYDEIMKKMVGGIKLDNGDVIACDVGDLIAADNIGEGKNFKIIDEYDTWVDLTDEIVGD